MNCGIVLPSGARFFGYHRDHARNRMVQSPVGTYLVKLAAGVIPDSATTEAFWGPICNQGQSGSCGGHGTYQGIYTACGALGVKLTFYPSMQLTYSVTRALERPMHADGSLDPLTDSGVMPTDLVTDVGVFGVGPMLVQKTPDGRFSDVWSSDDVDPKVASPNVNDEPDYRRLETAGKTLVTGEYRVDESSPDAYDHCAAVVGIPQQGAPHGVPVGVGMFVDSAFMSWQAGDPPLDAIDTSDPQGGGHWLMLGKYERSASGRIWTLVNSWDKTWGDAGTIRLTERALRQSVSDLLPWTVRTGSLGRGLDNVRSLLTAPVRRAA